MKKTIEKSSIVIYLKDLTLTKQLINYPKIGYISQGQPSTIDSGFFGIDELSSFR